jgi:putative hydrolase of the HAD superfamily
MMPGVMGQQPARWQLFDDALPCLRALTVSGWRHVILSNHVPELPALIEALGLASHVEQVFNSAQTGVEKPHPQAFHSVLTALGGVTQIWMVGDSMRADIAGAQAVGLRAVLVRGRHPQAAYCCATLAELPYVLSSTEQSRASYFQRLTRGVRCQRHYED